MVVQIPSLIIQDNFVDKEGFALQRHEAATSEYGVVDYKGFQYSGIAKSQIEFPWKALEAILPSNLFVSPTMAFYRSGKSGVDQGTWIHPDTGMDCNMAGIWYLTSEADPFTGTAFWEHRATGLSDLPKLQEIADNEGDVAAFLGMLDEDGEDESNWIMNDFAQARSNRFITFPTARFHSRYPRSGYGETAIDSRLIMVCFYNLYEKK